MAYTKNPNPKERIIGFGMRLDEKLTSFKIVKRKIKHFRDMGEHFK